MPHITVYSGPGCPYCVRAKALLEKKGVRSTKSMCAPIRRNWSR